MLLNDIASKGTNDQKKGWWRDDRKTVPPDPHHSFRVFTRFGLDSFDSLPQPPGRLEMPTNTKKSKHKLLIVSSLTKATGWGGAIFLGVAGSICFAKKLAPAPRFHSGLGNKFARHCHFVLQAFRLQYFQLHDKFILKEIS